MQLSKNYHNLSKRIPRKFVFITVNVISNDKENWGEIGGLEYGNYKGNV